MSRAKTSAAKDLASTVKKNSKPAIRKGGIIQPPAHLTPPQLKIWNNLVESIDTSKLLAVDAFALARYCYWVDIYLRSIEKSNGCEVELFVQGDQELRRINPDFQIAEKAEKQIQTFEKDFGFNLRSRLQMAEAFAEEEKEHDPMSEFFTR